MRFIREDIAHDKNGNKYRAYICKDNNNIEHPLDVWITWLNIHIPIDLRKEKSLLSKDIISKIEKYAEYLYGS